MSTIKDIKNPWRDALLPASFKNITFHVESASVANGRRIATHEFPKKENPYSEDMGRRSFGFSVRGYVISFMYDSTFPLYQRDYRIPRDMLRDALDTGGYGWLQLPTLRPARVVCRGYSLTEETRLGGFCVFDMQFVELGISPESPAQDSRGLLIDAAAALADSVMLSLGTAFPPTLTIPPAIPPRASARPTISPP